MARQPSNHPPAESPSWVKQQTLKILRSMINRLQAIADRLETPPRSGPQRPIFPLWNQLLSRVRGWLPTPWNRNINDFDLTLALGTILALSLAIFVSLLPSRLPEVVRVPEIPEPTETIELPEAEVPEIAPEPETAPEEISPEPIPEEIPEEESPEPIEEATQEPEPPEITEIEEPVEQEEEEEEEEEDISEPIPVEIAPPPPPVLTPEQRLIVTIQEQVNRLTEKYEEGLIDSLQANFLNSLLVLKVDRRWYDLPLEQQKRLANDMLRRSRKLDFSRLEIVDLDGHLLARNSVVGTQMVILKAQDFSGT
ncbi:MAG: hypothetical protein J7545_09440 [Roseofilum sp. SBFL]|uniref:hypothetical protein n=1 Tax=unclassified Roseofilum TaxID=2620099 RepID=UPI001B0921BB|nr:MULTISPECIES: hypothetical protein [unclassified Roseofilum]MBP0014652.1 hypothetical protein [Roseofilum sp. SID3]MBP0024771.1 hypothetical protein [Roseofilum sp. SID2]MBP0036501.1 hypothetical protein [Roseofilum sp. SID1]MBP0042182.1 hypothetical protein [Roseofilum sp. SBFL]